MKLIRFRRFAGVTMGRLFVLAVVVSLLQSAPAQPPVTALAFSPDGSQVVLGSQHGIEVRAWPSLDLVRELETSLPHIHDLAFSPEGDRLLAGGGAPSEYGGFEIFSWPEGRLVHEVVDHEDVVYGVSWAGDGNRFATASGDGRVASWSSSGATRERTFRGHSRRVLALTYLPEPGLLVSGGVDQSIRVWDVASGELLRTLDNHTDAVRCIAARPAAGSLPMVASAAADRTVRFWQPTIGRMVRFARLPAEPLSLAWTPAGRRLAVGCSDGHVRIIDPETLEVVSDDAAIDGWVYAIAVAPSGKALAAGGSDGRVVCIEIDAQAPHDD